MSENPIGPNPCGWCGGEYGEHKSDCYGNVLARQRKDEEIEALAQSLVFEIAEVAEVVDWSRKDAAGEVSKALIELIEKMIDRKLGR